MNLARACTLGVVAGLAFAAAAGAAQPNVIVVLWDDAGFAEFGCYGAALATPNVDRLAASGLRYTNFRVAPVCSPTRAALLTGRNPHAVGVGHIGEYANGNPNMIGGPRLDAGTLADYLRAAGYATFAVGKWHLTPVPELNASGASAWWPTGRGFDRFYGYMGGDTNQFAPELFRERTRIALPATLANGDPYYLDGDLVDQSIGFINEHRAIDPRRPFFLYLAFCAGHAPNHAPPEYLARWRGRFDRGWDTLRADILARQKAMGLVPADVILPPANPGVPAWSELSTDERRVCARFYEAFAANMEYTDRHLGRLLDHLEHTGLRDDTLIVMASDNGATNGGGRVGNWSEIRAFATGQGGDLATGVKHVEEIGGPLTYPLYSSGWAQAGNTPFRGFKGSTYEGGVRTMLVTSWPSRISDSDSMRTQFLDVIDVLPTVLEAVGASAPAVLDGRTQVPITGRSFAATWDDAHAPSPRDTQYVEISGHRSIYHQGWKALTVHASGTPYEQDAWQLFHLDRDFNETYDLAATHPEKLAELLARWEQEANANGVHPLDDRRGNERDIMRSPENLARTHAAYHPPVSGLHKYVALDHRGRSMTITAELERAAGDNGVILAHGGRFAGYALYVLRDRLVFTYNFGGDVITRIAMAEALPAGAFAVQTRLELRQDGGADVTLFLGERVVASGRVPRTLPGNISHESLDLACDLYTPVSEDYVPPFAFDGTVRKVTVETSPPP